MPSLQPFGENIWIVDGPEVRDFGILFTTRMAVVKLFGGSLWLDSPVYVPAETLHQIAALGPVRRFRQKAKLTHEATHGRLILPQAETIWSTVHLSPCYLEETKMRAFLLGILATLVAVPLCGWLYLRLGFADLRANSRPSWIESGLLASSLDASAARHASEQTNPIQPTESNLLDGARLYRDKCADCHGRPDNPVSDYGGSFYPPAPQFMKEHLHLQENRNFYVIKYGVRWSAMPAWGHIMADSEIWQVVAFLNRLDHLPPAIEPELHKPAGSTP